MDIDKLTHAVDQARIQMYATYGVALPGFDTERFAHLMAHELGIDVPQPDGPQPPLVVVTSEEAPEPEAAGGSIGAGAEITDEDIEADFEQHVFRPNRGGVDCITCHKPESEGNHSS